MNIFTEEIMNSFYNVNFLDNFTSETLPQKVTSITPTFNRSPYDPSSKNSKLNPLKWHIDSLISQKNSGLKSIMIIDDASNDYTRDVIKLYQKTSPIEVVYIKNEERLGLPITRNKGIENTDTDFIYLSDDDCIDAPYAIHGGLFTFLKLKEHKEKIGTVNLPVYNRATIPPYMKLSKDIGKIDLENGILSFDSHAFPSEYVGNKQEEKFLDKKRKILNPIQIDNFNAHLFCSRDALKDVGGFPEDFTWRNSAGEETEIALRLQENGYKKYFNPDIKFHAVHLKYGAQGREELKGYDWKENLPQDVNLKEMVKISAKSVSNTGCRVPSSEWIESDMLGHLTVIGKRNIKGALNLAKRTYERFVLRNDPGIYTTFCSHIEDEKKRKDIWESAIEKTVKHLGGNLSKNQFLNFTTEYENVIV